MKFLALLSMLVACAAASAADAPPAATVRMLIGRAEAIAADGTRRALAEHAPIMTGERVETGPQSFVDLDFADGGKVLLQPVTQFLVEEFRAPAVESAAAKAAAAAPPESAFFRLLKGGLRAITGLVGKTDRARYALRTAVATIGVRGTEYELRVCQGDCGTPEAPIADGLYAAVAHGTIALVNDAGEHLAHEGESAFVRDRHSLGERVRKRPPALDRAELSNDVRQQLQQRLQDRYSASSQQSPDANQRPRRRLPHR